MRKRLGILLLILCLLFIFPTQMSYSEDLGNISGQGNDILLAPLVVAALIFGVAYDLATNRCVLNWHPGDYYYEKNYKIIKPINKKIFECHDNCFKKMDLNVTMGSVRSNKKDDSGNFIECYNPCFKEAIKPFPTTLATCAFKESDDYYTDGSYYKPRSTDSPSLQKIFTNKHKLRNKYEKTDWQQARDKCMELTWKKNDKTYFKSIESRNIMMIDFYYDCLKERRF